MVGTDRSQTASKAVGLGGRVRRALRRRAAPGPGRGPHEPDRHRVRLGRADAGGRGRRGPAAGGASGSPATAAAPTWWSTTIPRWRSSTPPRRPTIDVLVVGNAGMAGRKEFLLGNVPNRISHNARCTVIIVNTTDGVGDAVRDPREPHHDPFERRRDRDAAAPHGARHHDRHRLRQARAEGALRSARLRKAPSAESDRRSGCAQALEELGPTFCKLGQILSTRPDLIPPEFIDELAQLQDNVPPLTEEQVVKVMEQELGVPWEDVFEHIDPAPLAAGTIAQVHRAGSRTTSPSSSRCSAPTRRSRSNRTSRSSRCSPEKVGQPPAAPAGDRHAGRVRAPVDIAAPGAGLPAGSTEHGAAARRRRAVLAARRARAVSRLLHVAAPRDARRAAADRSRSRPRGRSATRSRSSSSSPSTSR